MFTTYPAFKNPVQFDRLSTNWRAVELMTGHPFLLVQTSDDGFHRHLLLHGMDDLLSVHRQFLLGVLNEVSLLQPPSWSASGGWNVIRMSELLFQVEPPDGSVPTAVVRDGDGHLYGGHPIKRLTGETGPIDFLLRV